MKWYLAWVLCAISSSGDAIAFAVSASGLAESSESDVGNAWVSRMSGGGRGGLGSDECDGGGVRSERNDATSAEVKFDDVSGSWRSRDQRGALATERVYPPEAIPPRLPWPRTPQRRTSRQRSRS
mgnify:FL=1